MYFSQIYCINTIYAPFYASFASSFKDFKNLRSKNDETNMERISAVGVAITMPVSSRYLLKRNISGISNMPFRIIEVRSE